MEAVEPPKESSLLERIRSMWEFANLVQWIFIFGRAVKIDENLDVEDIEMECLKSHSTVLPEIGLALLKFVSSHRGLTPEIFDEYTRRQYVAKAPHRNPFGVEEEPAKFVDFEVFTKIRVLQQLTQWTMGNPDRIREKMEEQKDHEQTIWRIEPFGWDSDDRTYFVLDDNRLYRRTDPPLPPLPAAKPKKNSKKAKAARRASKRRKLSEPAESETEPAEDGDPGDDVLLEKADDGFGGMKWECVAVTFDEVNSFVASLEKSRDPNEKILRKRVAEDLLPLLEKQEEARKRKQAQKERELLNLEKLASAKRSSRIAGRLEQQKQEEEAREAERKRQTELVMAKKEQEKWMKLEKERESRMMTREQRLKEREARRILHEEELANLSEDNKKLESGIAAGRLSERHLKAEIERKKQALEELAEEEDWIFDCICGAYGQIDDGTHSIACDKCNIWQHSKCVGVSQAEADREDFHFICNTCDRRAKDAERAKTHPPIKIRINRPGSSSSPTAPKQNGSVGSSLGGTTQQSYTTETPKPLQQSPSPNTPRALIQPDKSNGLQIAQGTSPQVPQQVATIQSNSQPLEQPSNMMSIERVPKVAPSPPSPYTSNTGADHPPYSISRPSSSHRFPSPHLNGPAILSPPMRAASNSFVNGNSSQYEDGPIDNPQVQSTPVRQNIAGYSPSPPADGQQPMSINDVNRRNSLNLSSPLASTPVLTPKVNHTNFPTSSSPTANYIPTAQPVKISPQPTSTPQTQLPQILQNQDSGHTSILPPPTTGYSPTKHSPPRPSTANGSFGLSTPVALPPVTSLSPSPQIHNLTPPVKPSEPERNRDYGQSVGS